MKTTAEKIAVMQAYEQGKTIFVEATSCYVRYRLDKKNEHDVGVPTWAWGEFNYEVVKEPRTLYVAILKETGDMWYSSFNKAYVQENYSGRKEYEIVEFIEKL